MHLPVGIFIFVTPILFAVFLVLLVLKLLRKINVSWFWVTAPVWFPWAALLVPPFICAALTGQPLYTH